jgi:hypothetical protein
MLGLFSNKSDHPLADMKSAQQLLDHLPKTDVIEILNEIGHWIEALFDPANEFRLDHQYAVMRMLDEAAHPHLRKIIHAYFAAVSPNEFQEKRLWGAMNAYFTFCEMGYLHLMKGMRDGDKGSSAIKSAAALISARGIYAASGKLECAAVRYAKIEPGLWGHLADFYDYAEMSKCQDEALSLYAGLGAVTSVSSQFTSVLMWYASVMGALRPLDLHIAKRLNMYLSKSFAVSEECRENSMFVFDLAKPSSPIRIKEEGSMYPPSSRFIGVGQVSGALDNMLKTLGKNLVPEELNLGVAYSAEVVAEVVSRVAAFYQARQPVRRPARRNIKMKISALNGFFNMVEETSVDLNLNDPLSESWEVEDISANGLRCVLAEGRASNIAIGALVGLQPEKSLHWGVGIVRRLKRDARNNLHVGIRIISNKVSSVVLRDQSGDAGYSALLLDGPAEQGGESLLLMNADTFSISRSPTMTLDELSFLLMPLGLVEKGVDFELVRYRKMAHDDGGDELY